MQVVCNRGRGRIQSRPCCGIAHGARRHTRWVDASYSHTRVHVVFRANLEGSRGPRFFVAAARGTRRRGASGRREGANWQREIEGAF